jgi:uncharacterized ferritin-like protein (DUF455 family)
VSKTQSKINEKQEQEKRVIKSILQRVGFVVYKNGAFLIRINKKWYRFQKESEKSDKVAFFNITLPVLVFLNDMEALKNGTKKGARVYLGVEQ